MSENKISDKIFLVWGEAGVGQPPSEREIKNTIATMRKRASKSNVFTMDLSEGMLNYLKEHLRSSNAVIKVISRTGTGKCYVIIGTDEKTAQDEYDRI